ncbi:SDR family NAD(P)-dependent oxidoreductase [Amycolatopsis jejuensis]|uniref:SDR family NAD(P)-dependent oxidoreductase n=1 Tax=Amycolatopsis jejuensis TaxID=330084 RepID=UPI000AE3404D|nr:SDR family NAD(P)-dependent oxidoreductase [Amycolatopsis jejuensis]
MPEIPKTIIVTGASDGIGAAAARHLAGLGHRVVVVGRSADKVEAIGRELGADHFSADFTRLDDVRTLAETLTERYPRIDVLANNAGAILGKRTETADGFEESFQVNYLAPVLLTTLLLDPLLAGRATVIQTASNAARLSARVRLDDLGTTEGYTPVRAYGNAKQELVLFTQELHNRYHGKGLSTVAFHPGGTASRFAQSSRSAVGTLFRTPIPRLLFQSPEKAARQLVRFAVDRDWESGAYYESGRIRALKTPPIAGELWERSMELVAR